jgi:hypothetical protein
MMPTWTSCIKGHPSRAVCALLLLLAAPVCQTAGMGGQFPQGPPSREEPKRMPDGRLQSEVLIKQDFKENQKDLDEMKKLIEEVMKDMEKNQQHALSMKSLKQLEEVEKISKRIRNRMTRF